MADDRAAIGTGLEDHIVRLGDDKHRAMRLDRSGELHEFAVAVGEIDILRGNEGFMIADLRHDTPQLHLAGCGRTMCSGEPITSARARSGAANPALNMAKVDRAASHALSASPLLGGISQRAAIKACHSVLPSTPRPAKKLAPWSASNPSPVLI